MVYEFECKGRTLRGWGRILLPDTVARSHCLEWWPYFCAMPQVFCQLSRSQRERTKDSWRLNKWVKTWRDTQLQMMTICKKLMQIHWYEVRQLNNWGRIFGKRDLTVSQLFESSHYQAIFVIKMGKKENKNHFSLFSLCHVIRSTDNVLQPNTLIFILFPNWNNSSRMRKDQRGRRRACEDEEGPMVSHFQLVGNSNILIGE